MLTHGQASDHDRDRTYNLLLNHVFFHIEDAFLFYLCRQVKNFTFAVRDFLFWAF